jgi:dCMP deaminase
MITNNQFMQIAEVVAQSSHATRRKVGAIIVKDNNIVAVGYNGTFSGFDNTCEIDGVTRPEVLHAETNAIAKCSRSNNSSEGASLYVTTVPCFNCALAIIQAGITKVYWRETYRDLRGLELLKNAKQIEIVENV